MAEQPSPPDTVHPDTAHPDTAHRETVRVRRAPRYGVFLVLGAALGVFVAMILTFAFHGTDEPSAAGVQYTQLQVFGFLALIGIAVGVAVGGVVAVAFDRASARRSREVGAFRERVRTSDD